MRRINKNPNSLVISEKIAYKKSGNRHLSEILHEEQNHLCAYTEEYIGRADRGDIEHFNPTLKGTPEDGYENWYLVKSQWNIEKGDTRRWNKFQPLIHPTAQDFEARILYDNGRYIVADENDVEARNLRSYLKLDDEELAKQRVFYIQRMKSDIVLSGLSNQEFIDLRLLMPAYRSTIFYIRAIEEELNIRVNFDLLKTT